MLKEMEENEEYEDSLFQAEMEFRDEMEKLDLKDHEGFQNLHKKYVKNLENIRAKFLARFMLGDSVIEVGEDGRIVRIDDE